jgi:hypothetical protein
MLDDNDATIGDFGGGVTQKPRQGFVTWASPPVFFGAYGDGSICEADAAFDQPDDSGRLTFRRKMRKPECWGRIGAVEIFCKPGRIFE